jgi:hypothetical protein
MRVSVFIVCMAVLLLPANLIAQGGKHKPVKPVKNGWKKSGSSYNPYLRKKAKNKPSALMAKQDKKELKRQKKAARKQMRRSKKSLSR